MPDFTIDCDPYPLDYAGNPLARACIPWRGPVDKNGYQQRARRARLKVSA